MGSLNNGQHISKDTKTVRHLGHQLTIVDSQEDLTVAEVSNSGTIRTVGEDTTGVVFARSSTTYTSGLALDAMTADNSVERQKFTSTEAESGALSWEYTRKLDGTHISVSTVEADSSLGEAETVTERKVFFIETDRGKTSGFADWNIYTSGTAVGAGEGTTDIDTSPAATFDGTGDPV